MNITIDSGNTLTKIGFFENGKLINLITVKDSSHLIDLLPHDKNANVVIASVNESYETIRAQLTGFRKVVVLDHLTKIPLNNLYKSPETLGMDRLAAAVGVRQFFKEGACLVIDAGSCITFDLVDAQNNYLGGSISPGILIRFKSLHAFTSRLPLLDFSDFDDSTHIDLIGKNTRESILSGVVNGIVAEVGTTILEYRKLYPGLRILICGGDGKYFESKIKQSIFAIPELVHWGLNRILEHNESEF